MILDSSRFRFQASERRWLSSSFRRWNSYEVEPELYRDPRRELKGDVLVGIGAAIAARAGPDPDRAGLLHPLLGGEHEAVDARLHSNPVEFDGVEGRVVQALPDAQELHGAAVAQPVAHHVVRMVRVLVPGDVRETDEVLAFMRHHGDRSALDFDGGFGGLCHGPARLTKRPSRGYRQYSCGGTGWAPG